MQRQERQVHPASPIHPPRPPLQASASRFSRPARGRGCSVLVEWFAGSLANAPSHYGIAYLPVVTYLLAAGV